MRLPLRIFYTVVVVGLVFITFIWVSDPFSNEAGTLDLLVYDADDEKIIDETYTFDEEDTLFTVMDEHHEMVCADRSYEPDPDCETEFGNYGRILLGIEDIMTDWNNTFLYLEVNGTQANRGMDTVELEDGNEYAWYVRDAD
ncbi:MAG: hypothetical protein ACOC14_01750 [Bacillota bacterium]